MEYWSSGVVGLNPNTPAFHHSITPIYFAATGGVL
jgi:hypothetical protein